MDRCGMDLCKLYGATKLRNISEAEGNYGSERKQGRTWEITGRERNWYETWNDLEPEVELI